MNKFRFLVLSTALAMSIAAAAMAAASGPNLVQNGTFDNSVAGWTNAGGNPTWSRWSMKLTNDYAGAGNSYYGADYCVHGINQGRIYTTAWDYKVSIDAPTAAGAGVSTEFFSSNDCSGYAIANGDYWTGGAFSPDDGSWVHFQFQKTAPLNARSMRITAFAFKEPGLPSGSIPQKLIVHFDNVSTVQEPIPLEPGGQHVQSLGSSLP
jgi:hypothetical protein